MVADSLSGATGIAVDSVGNIFIAEPGASRISLVTHKNQFFYWANVVAPLYLAFTWHSLSINSPKAVKSRAFFTVNDSFWFLSKYLQ